MNAFIEKPINKMSLAYRSTIFSVGINDSKYKIGIKINGKMAYCPYYKRWNNMLRRCYSDQYHSLRPTYSDCSVCKEWLLFSNFKAWMEKQEWQGLALDKDLIFPGNKTYSPESCIFVSIEINSLSTDCAAIRGIYPVGVNFNTGHNAYQSRVSVAGKRVLLGYFSTPEEAYETYKKAKSNHVRDIAAAQSDLRIRKGLMIRADMIEENIWHR